MEKEKMEQDGSGNEFEGALKIFNVYTQNGAISNNSSGSSLLNYFAKAGNYRDREQNLVDDDLQRIWSESPLITVRLIFYFRMITRTLKGFLESEKVQRGQGSRDEFRKSLIWLNKYHPEVLYANLWIVPLVGCWKDLWHPTTVNVLDKTQVYDLVKRGIADAYNVGLIAKYLPAIRSGGHVTTPERKDLNVWAKGLCKHLGWTLTQYRKFKSSKDHTAHSFQREMCAGLWDKLNFNRIPGKALLQIVSKKGKDGKTVLERHDQVERYTKWLEKKPTAKFTGYVYELYKEANQNGLSAAKQMTFNKQFDGLIELAKKDTEGIKSNVWCALDTSGSMQTPVIKQVTALDLCISLGIYFATLNEGAFHNHVVMFDSTSTVLQLEGTFCDKVKKIVNETTAWGSTNFDSVIEMICETRRSRPEIPVADYPDTLIVVSDMQFNPVGGNEETNYQSAMKKLAEVGLPKMKIIWWFVTNAAKDFPSTIKDEGVTMIGGFDGSVVSLILGGKTTVIDTNTGKERALNAYENMLKSLDQEVLLQLSVPKK